VLEKAAQVLVVLLGHGLPAEFASGAEEGGQAEGSEEPGASEGAPLEPEAFRSHNNVFKALLARVGEESETDLEAVFNGLARLLNNVHESVNVYLPGSLMLVECYQEVLVLLWKLLEGNLRFMPYILKNCDVTELVTPIVYFMYEARRDPARVGLIHICTFILLKLSGERNFAVQMNQPYEASLPCDLPLFVGTHCDLVVITLHKLVVNGLDKLSPLYNCFLTIICNISPYCKSLSAVAAVKLVSLFELFTSPRFLYAAEGNHLYVALLLEIFNNVVQYQYTGNPQLIYAIIRRKASFQSFADLTLPKALEQAQQQAITRGQGGRAGGASEVGDGSGLEDVAAPQAPTAVVGTTVTGEDGVAAPSVPPPKAPPAAEEGGEASGSSGLGSEGEQRPSPIPSSGEQPAARFTPTQEWLAAVKGELPLNTLTRLLQHLVPQIEELIRNSEMTVHEEQVLSFIRNNTMVGLLPVPHAIVIRKYTPNHFTGLWFTAFMWGVVFLQNQFMPLFDGSTIKLFTVTLAPPPAI